MNNRIARHVTFEILRAFAIALAAMTCLMVLVFLIQEGLREKLTIAAVLKLVPYTLPTALCFAIPGTILFAVCICYGRMSSQNEIVAVKAMGVSPLRMVTPAIVIAILLSLTTVWLNDVAASWGRRGIYRVILHTSAQTIYAMLGAQGTFARGKMFIDVTAVEGDNLIHPFFEITGDDPGDTLRMRAHLARILVDIENEQLIIRVKDAQLLGGSQYRGMLDEDSFPIPLGDITKRKNDGQSPSVLSLAEIPHELKMVRARTGAKREQLAAELAADILAGNTIEVTHPAWGGRLHELEEQKYLEYKLLSEPWRRWANGFSCLAFVIVGAPLSILLQRFDFWTNFALCFIPILLIYYPLLMYGIGEAKSGNLPPVSVWLGNVVMIVIGIGLLLKVQKS